MARTSRKRGLINQAKGIASLTLAISGALLLSSFQNAINRTEKASALSTAVRAAIASTGRPWWWIWREAASGWIEHKAASLGASLAYYSMFSLGPLLLIAITVAGFAFGEDAAR